MRSFLLLCGGLLVLCFTGTTAFGALQEEGTLTLEGETVTFHTPMKDVVFDMMKCPGLFLIKYDPKTVKKNGKEIDVSEATYADETGRHFTLVQGKPQDVTRELVGEKTKWKFPIRFRS
ncbi:hypothetical protein BH09VER1_BH09VER1_48270 [soil metagenome]